MRKFLSWKLPVGRNAQMFTLTFSALVEEQVAMTLDERVGTVKASVNMRLAQVILKCLVLTLILILMIISMMLFENFAIASQSCISSCIERLSSNLSVSYCAAPSPITTKRVVSYSFYGQLATVYFEGIKHNLQGIQVRKISSNNESKKCYQWISLKGDLKS